MIREERLGVKTHCQYATANKKLIILNAESTFFFQTKFTNSRKRSDSTNTTYKLEHLITFNYAHQGRTHGEGRPPMGPKSTRFSGFPPLNYVISIFAVGILNLFAMRED